MAKFLHCVRTVCILRTQRLEAGRLTKEYPSPV